MAFAFGWSGMLPLLLSESGPFGVLPIALPWQPFGVILSVFGLALPAFLVTAATDGKAGVRDLLRRSLRWRVGVHWYLIALLGLLVVTLLGALPFLGVVPLEALAQNWSLLFTVFLPGVLIPFVLVNLWEELGWTGFMQHTLQERHGPLLASIMVAPPFVLFHLPLTFLEAPRITLAVVQLAFVQLAVQAIVVVFFRVVIMWLYNGTGRSVLIVALFHSAFNSAGTGSDYATRYIEEIIPGPAALLIPMAVVVVAAVLVTVFTRGRLAYEPKHAARPAPKPPTVEPAA
jgi:membrane protease YdiL (CAAX protease family)